MRKIVKLFAVAVGVATLAACARPVSIDVGAPAVPTGEPEIGLAWTSCEKDGPGQESSGGTDVISLPRLGDGFVPTTTVVCDTKIQPRPEGGEDLLAIEGRTDDVAALVAALRLPDLPRTDKLCTLDLPSVAWFVLLDATGRWVRPGTPVDSCGKVRIEVREAVTALELTTVSSRTVRAIVTPEAARAGCGQSWSDMLSVEISDQSGRTGTYAVEIASSAGIRLCVYTVPVEQQGTAKPAGDFEYGGVVQPQRWSAIDQALRSAGAVRECTQHAGRFAVLRQADNISGEVYVELDGCRRIMSMPFNGPPGFAQADAELLALLSKQ